MTDTLQERVNKPNLRKLAKDIQFMTDEEWQEKMELLRIHNKPVNDKDLTRHTRKPYIVGKNWTLSDNNGGEMTQDSWYCHYINDVLEVIRGKRRKEDHCYDVYQIYDLLKFEPNLNTKLIHDGESTYFKVWLDKQ